MNRVSKGLLIGGGILAAAAMGAWRLGYLNSVLPASLAKAAADPAAAAKPGDKNKRPPQGPTAVVVDQARVIDAPIDMNAVGLAEASQTVSVRSRVDGQIAEVLFSEGQEVKAGQVLFQLDPRSAEALMRQAEGTLARDRAQLANARREAERLSGLIARDFVSRSGYDSARAQAAALEGTVKASEANLEQLKVQLSYHTIIAPVDGRVGRQKLTAGANIRAADATPLVVINRVKPIDVAFTLPQNQLEPLRAALASGAAVAAARTPDGGSSQGKISFIDNAIDPLAGAVTVKAQFANADEKLWPGMYAPISLRLGVQRGVTAVPNVAVQGGQKGAYVYVVQEGTARYREVEIGRVMEEMTVIAKGLTPGERVVVDGQMRLTDGAKIDPRDRDGKSLAPRPPQAAQAPAAPAK